MCKLLEGKVAVVTGGARGIGEGIAEIFAQNGADIVLVDINEEILAPTVEKMQGYAVRAMGVKLNIMEVEKISEAVDSILAKFGRIDIWVNNAGITQNVSVDEITEKQWDTMLDINLKGTVFCSQAAFRAMKDSGGGRIINISSIAGQRGGRFAGVNYSSSKAGVIVATKSFALSGAQYGILVNAIAPGLIATKMSEQLGFDNSGAQVPLGRLGTPEDIAKAALFLASPLSDYVTGQTLSVNGGLYMP